MVEELSLQELSLKSLNCKYSGRRGTARRFWVQAQVLSVGSSHALPVFTGVSASVRGRLIGNSKSAP